MGAGRRLSWKGQRLLKHIKKTPLPRGFCHLQCKFAASTAGDDGVAFILTLHTIWVRGCWGRCQGPSSVARAGGGVSGGPGGVGDTPPPKKMVRPDRFSARGEATNKIYGRQNRTRLQFWVVFSKILSDCKFFWAQTTRRKKIALFWEGPRVPFGVGLDPL